MGAEASGRRLAAIMFTDIVGYTALTERDEAAALSARERHRALLRPLVEQFEGTLVETPGDESLSVFPSALLAVDCALAVQAALRDDATLRLRIGLHVGDVLHRDGEVIGEGVNVAARIRPLAEPGGICISGAIWRQVQSRAHLQAQPLGAKGLKNVGEPVEIFSLQAGAADGVQKATPSGLVRVGIGLAMTALVAFAFYYPNRTAVLSTLLLYVPLVLPVAVEQEVGFATASDGVRIAYGTSGSGPPVVSVLGWGTHLEQGLGSALYDAEGLLSLATRRNLYVQYDGRGFGLSDRDVTDFSLDARVRDLESVVDALGLERVGIYAFSAGGPTGIAFAARHPERVSRLVLASTLASFDWLDDSRRARFLKMLDLFETDWETPLVTNMMVDLLDPAADGVQRRLWSELFRRSAEGAAMAGFFRTQIEVDVEEQARAISVPTLVVHGREDTVHDLEAGRRLASLIPGARFEIVEGDHIAGVGSTPEVRSRIMRFLADGT